ncbi:MAG: signal peptidase II [Clostridia bacterium]|nr:signal peptidase II [Clostridia bacterium]
MQRVGANRKRIIIEIAFICLILFLISLDQTTKIFFKDLRENKGFSVGSTIVVIKGFFYFKSVPLNDAAAYGFLGGLSWRQTFFIILTFIAIIGFIYLYYYSVKKNYTFMKVAVIFIIAGAIGNLIDRLAYGGVVDFLTIEIGSFTPFAVFNLADTFLSVGLILLIIHFFFLDENAVFSKKQKETAQNKDGNEDNKSSE